MLKIPHRTAHLTRPQGQTAIEYMLLLAVVVTVVLVALNRHFPDMEEGLNLYYNNVGRGILGEPPPRF